MGRSFIKLPINNRFFLLGPRGTGKSTLLKAEFLPQLALEQVQIFDLLDPELLKTSLDVGRRTFVSRSRQTARVQWVVIDEVQKVPALLDVAHQLIESRGLRLDTVALRIFHLAPILVRLLHTTVAVFHARRLRTDNVC